MNLIWATRGLTWGFRFLRTGGFSDPLPEYERVFSNVEDGREAWLRVGEKVALRFPDPSGRQDRAGRVIPHDFVISGPLAAQINSVEDGRREIWPLVRDTFAKTWDQPKPPAANA